MMDMQVGTTFSQVRAAMVELREGAGVSQRWGVIAEEVSEQLIILSTIRSGSTASDHERNEIRLLALEIRCMIGVPTENLTREILWGGTASIKQQIRAISLRFHPRRRRNH